MNQDVPVSECKPRSLPAFAVAVLLFLNLVLRLQVATRPLPYIDGLTIPDDAYLSLTIARNIAHGLGPSYAGQYTNGFQPLYVALMVPVYMLLHDDVIMPIRVALVFLSLCDTFTLLILLRLLARLTLSSPVQLLTALAWICNPYIIVVATNGLETALAALCIAWSFSYYQRRFMDSGDPGGAKAYLALGGIVGVAMLARIDSIFLAPVMGSHMFWRHRKEWRSALRNVLLIAAGTIAAYSPWLFYSFSSTGDFFPVSGRAVHFMELSALNAAPTFANCYSRMLGDAAWAVFSLNLAPVVLLTVMLVALAIIHRRGLRHLAGRSGSLGVWWGFAASLSAAYIFYFFAAWFFSRYLHPVRIPLLLTFALVSGAFLEYFSKKALRVSAAALLAVALVAIQCSDPYFGRLFTSRNSTDLGYMNLGLWARSTFTPGTVIGGSQSGAAGYFADNLKVINLDGVVNKACYESLVRGENMKYIREHRIEYIFGWNVNFFFIQRHSRGFTWHDLSAPERIEGFRSWNNDWYLAKVVYPEGG